MHDFNNQRQKVEAKEEWSSTFGWLLVSGSAIKDQGLGEEIVLCQSIDIWLRVLYMNYLELP